MYLAKFATWVGGRWEVGGSGEGAEIISILKSLDFLPPQFLTTCLRSINTGHTGRSQEKHLTKKGKYKGVKCLLVIF